MNKALIEMIKTTNTIVCMVNNKIKYAKCRHTGKFIKHSIAVAEMKQQIDVNAKVNLSIVFVSLFVAVLYAINVEMIDIVLSTLSVVGFLSMIIVLTNKKDIVLFQ